MEDEEIEYYDSVEIENHDAEVLSLTEWDDGGSSVKDNGMQVVAEYVPIDITTINKTVQIKTKSFVSKVLKFITDLEGESMTDERKSFLKTVAEIQVTNISDLSYLLTTNRELLDNVLRRINASQADDYININLYSSLVTQHLKLSKELNTAYKDLPTVMKRMNAEIKAENTEVIPELDPNQQQIITESFGVSQFNSQGDLLTKLKNQQAERSNSKVILNT